MNHRLLTREEEYALGYRSLAGDIHARNELILHNLKLVWKWARKYHWSWSSIPLSDLLQEGNLGLMKAAKKYNPAFGVRFSTCASPWIRQGVLDALSQSSLVTIPEGAYHAMRKINKTEIRLMEETGGKVSDAQIAKVVLLSEKRVKELRKGVRISSMDSDFSDDSENNLHDITPDETVDTDITNSTEHNGRVKKLLLLIDTVKNVSEKKKQSVREVIVRAYGLPDCGVDDCFAQTIPEIAEAMGISQTTVSGHLKLGKRILKKLGENLR